MPTPGDSGLIPSHSPSSQDWLESSVNTVIKRILGMAAPAFSDSGRPVDRVPLEQVRESLLALLHDCRDMQSQRVIYRINMAKTPAELWLLRSDLHQCIAQAHSQGEAAERINSLIEVFEGWLPAGQLLRI
jgi:DNA-binding FrmR family transcriptional regulator